MTIPETLDKSTVDRLILSHGTWKHLFYRCYSKISPDYKNYGGRGIDVHPSWHGDDGFYQFIKDVGLRPSKEYSLDRIDVDKGYSPDNVKWSTSIEQANNRRNSKRYLFEGENLTLAEIALTTKESGKQLRFMAIHLNIQELTQIMGNGCMKANCAQQLRLPKWSI